MTKAVTIISISVLVIITSLFAAATVHRIEAAGNDAPNTIPLGDRFDTFAASDPNTFPHPDLFTADVPRIGPGDSKRAPRAGMIIDPQTETQNLSSKPSTSNRFSRFWRSVQETAMMKRVSSVCSWAGDGLRLLWAIPKAVVKGDSGSLIEAIGALLSRASSEEKIDQEFYDPESDPISDEVDDSKIQSLLIRHKAAAPPEDRV